MKTEKIPEMQLPEKGELLESIFNAALVAICVTDKNRVVRQINPEFTRLFGYTEEEAVGKVIEDLIRHEEGRDFSELIEKNMKNGEGFDYETIRRTKDGKKIHVSCRLSPIFINSIPLAGVAFYTDITARKQAEDDLNRAHNELELKVEQRTGQLKESETRFRNLFEQSMAAEKKLKLSEQLNRALVENTNFTLNLIDTDYNLLMANPISATRRNTKLEEMLGKKCYRVFEGRDSVCPHCIASKVINTGKPLRDEKTVDMPGIGLLEMEFQFFPVFGEDGKVTAFIESVRDITHSKRTSEELQKAKEEAVRANMAKSQFLANMSHEIRTPLNGVLGVLNLLLSTNPDNEQLDLIETGKRSADSLLTVINDVLDFSKIEAGELDLEILNFNLHSSIAEIMELPAMQAHNKGLEIIYEIHEDIPSLLKGDPGRLRQVILNLTGNAIKFTDNGEIFISVSLVNETDKDVMVKFEVKDTGIGIPEDKLDIVFESFRQTDASTTRLYGGTGLGLSISKRLAELMGGEIGVISKPGVGSTFWFTARFDKQFDVIEKQPQPPSDIRGKRFLIVDDNYTNLVVLKGYIEAWGCFCDLANSGEIALSMLNAFASANTPFDAVITDMRMPGMNGMELGRRIKSDPGLKDTTIIMLTSQGIRGDASIISKIGFAAYLTKPIGRSQLFDCIVKVLTDKTGTDHVKKAQIITKYTISEEKRKKIRILLVEDNIVNQKLALRFIEKFGFKADSAANGKEAIKALESFHYDIVLMDIQMPEMDGLEATKIIRDPQSNVLNHNIKIIAMTAHAMQGDKERCINAGMNDYTNKPINPQELLNAIERQIRMISSGINKSL
ncbi:MAG: response regulator [Deltaproteobacteria bacterium]|nr:response regulator [Deltaproteobacteria bacterium]